MMDVGNACNRLMEVSSMAARLSLGERVFVESSLGAGDSTPSRTQHLGSSTLSCRTRSSLWLRQHFASSVTASVLCGMQEKSLCPRSKIREMVDESVRLRSTSPAVTLGGAVALLLAIVLTGSTGPGH